MKFKDLFNDPKRISQIFRKEKVFISPDFSVVINAIVNELKNSNILIITRNFGDAKIIKHIFPDVLLNPEFGLYPFEVSLVGKDKVSEKIEFLNAFYKTGRKIVISSLKGLFDPILPKEFTNELFISRKSRISMSKLSYILGSYGFKRTAEVTERGEFSVRGNIVDIYTFMYERPIRMLYGENNEIEVLKFFNIETRRSEDTVSSVRIHSITYFPFPETLWEEAFKRLKIHLNKARNEYLKDSAVEDFNVLRENGVMGINYYFKFFFNKGIVSYPTLIDMIDGYTKVYWKIINVESFIEETKEIYQKSVDAGEIIPFHIDIVRSGIEILKKGKSIYLSKLPERDGCLELPVKPMVESFLALSSFKEFILSYLKEKNIIIVTEAYERVKELLDVYGISPFNTKGLHLLKGYIEQGVETEKALVLTDKELFPHYKIRKPKKRILYSKRVASAEELNAGDYVVHNDFGIGIFKGLVKLKLANSENEYLLIEYRNGERLYVPMERIGFVERYIGDRRIISLNRLHGIEWQRTKERAKENARELARRLLRTQAERKLKGGFSFKPFIEEERILDLSFPYELTEDQNKAIEEVISDMELNTPMDKLVCGDVGYGKTEVAIRATFRAIMNGKQVAILVPTTVLAMQHGRTFRERLHLFPVEIGVLSRFTPKKEIKVMLKKLKEGTLDVLIGTHRILSDDVKFKDPGLLVIDEEQKFGVKDKEKIKEFCANIDLLTLTATPIPRTLHSALINLKSISLINTPPLGRFPVKTFVMPFDWKVGEKAIQFELNRNGQVFFVHNKIEDIYKFAEKLKYMLKTTKARIGIVHSKMDKEDLEQAMLSFYQGKLDILLSTTIIENGLDIPTVNTLIVDSAENFGLSQMYQLRGRVGRSHINAFAYFFFTRKKSLKAVAEERLETIKEFTGIGAGIKVAMKDLELRGAGNILGKEQHGHIVSVGYNMYVSLLDEAVAELKGVKQIKIKDVSVRLKEKYYIPSTYISMNIERMDYYRRITAAKSSLEIDEIRNELIDRFGRIPQEVKNLLKVGIIEAGSRDIGIKEVFQEGKRVFFTVDEENTLSANGIKLFLEQGKGVRFGKDYLSFEIEKNVIDEVLNAFNTLKGEKNCVGMDYKG